MQTLCNRCIRSLQSKGETVLIGYPLDEDTAEICGWCEKAETDLYVVMVNPFGSDCDGFEGR
jgi:hypothetical protein